MKRENTKKMSAQKIRRIRKTIGFSQEEFARFLWVTYSTLNRWEAGRAVPFGLPLRILGLLEEKLSGRSFRVILRDPRANDPTFLLYRLLQMTFGNHRSTRR